MIMNQVNNKKRNIFKLANFQSILWRLWVFPFRFLFILCIQLGTLFFSLDSDNILGCLLWSHMCSESKTWFGGMKSFFFLRKWSVWRIVKIGICGRVDSASQGGTLGTPDLPLWSYPHLADFCTPHRLARRNVRAGQWHALLWEPRTGRALI